VARRERGTGAGMTSDQTHERGDGQLEAFADDSDDADFAGEHDDSTLADQLEGGPEHAGEPESPRGRAGMD